MAIVSLSPPSSTLLSINPITGGATFPGTIQMQNYDTGEPILRISQDKTVFSLKDGTPFLTIGTDGTFSDGETTIDIGHAGERFTTWVIMMCAGGPR